MKSKKFDFRTAYIDLLLNVLTGIIFLFMLTTLLINKPKVDEGPRKNAYFMANIEWPSDMDCDVDTWVKNPDGTIVFFLSKDNGGSHLERDDLGFRNDVAVSSTLDPNDLKISENKETWVLRGHSTGEFTLNVHLYSCLSEGKQYDIGQKITVPVTVELIRLNPSYWMISKKTIILEKIWQEQTAMIFEIQKDNNVVLKPTEYRKLVTDKVR